MSIDELLKLEDREGHDRWLFSGKLVERRNGFHSPPHSSVVARLSDLLATWCRKVGSGLKPFGYACPYLLQRNPDTYLTYDASIVGINDSKTIRNADYLESLPLLAIEVKEIEDDEELILKTVETSLELGVREMWLIDPMLETVTCHSRDTKVKYFSGGMQLVGATLPGFAIPVAAIFE